MPVSIFAPNNTAILFIDYQLADVNKSGRVFVDEACHLAVCINKAANLLSIPVIMTSTETVLAELAGDWGSKSGRQPKQMLDNPVLARDSIANGAAKS